MIIADMEKRTVIYFLVGLVVGGLFAAIHVGVWDSAGLVHSNSSLTQVTGRVSALEEEIKRLYTDYISHADRQPASELNFRLPAAGVHSEIIGVKKVRAEF